MLNLIKIKFKNSITGIIFLVFFIFSLSFSFPVFAVSSAVTEAMTGANTAATKAFTTLPEKDITIIIGSIVGTALSFVGVLFFILFIYAGVMWMTARGNEQDVTKAKDLMQSAVIGLIIVLSAYAITTFITTQLVVAK